MQGQLIPPRSRSTVTREVDGEFVVIDNKTARAHQLVGDAAAVWRAAGTTADVDQDALRALTDLGLFDAPGMSRRTMLRRTGTVAAGVGIASIILPMASAAASVPASITLTPSTGPKGAVIGVSGSGFPANTLIQITFNGTPVAVSPGGVLTDGSGNIPAGVTFTVPSTANVGANTVAVVVGATSASATFTATSPTLTLQNAAGTTVTSGPKQILTVSGGGYLPGATITFRLDGTTVLGTATATPGGAIPANTTVTIPSGTTVAAHTIVATDTAGNTVSANYTVQAPTFTVTPATLPQNGSPVTAHVVSSSGFAPSAALTVSRTGGVTSIVGAPTATNSAGQIPTTNFTVNYGNGSSSNNGTITFTDSFGNTATFTWV